jgi:hypothetical protein
LPWDKIDGSIATQGQVAAHTFKLDQATRLYFDSFTRTAASGGAPGPLAAS